MVLSGHLAAAIENCQLLEEKVKLERELGERESGVPNYVSLYLATEGHRRPDPGLLGGQYAAMHLSKSLKPENIGRPVSR